MLDQSGSESRTRRMRVLEESYWRSLPESFWPSGTKFPKGFFCLGFPGAHLRALGNPDAANCKTHNLLVRSSEGYLG